MVFFDVADEGAGRMNKFIAYDLYPEARYMVWVGCRGRKQAKVSIGSNPWRPELRQARPLEPSPSARAAAGIPWSRR